jgi:hypothetical protein
VLAFKRDRSFRELVKNHDKFSCHNLSRQKQSKRIDKFIEYLSDIYVKIKKWEDVSVNVTIGIYKWDSSPFSSELTVNFDGKNIDNIHLSLSVSGEWSYEE